MGIRKLVNWINDNYNPGEIFISENGWTNGNLGYNDTDRIEYLNVPTNLIKLLTYYNQIFLQGYLQNILDAIHLDNVPVTHYTVWSVVDTFEWGSGYT